MLTLNLNYLENFLDQTTLDKLYLLLLSRNRKLTDAVFDKMLLSLLHQPEVDSVITDLSGSAISVDSISILDDAVKEKILEQLKSFIPWKKGPYRFFGFEIDSEWRSDLKWNRIAPYLPDLKGKVICDLGCNNGYFMFKAAHYQPSLVLGMDPTVRFKLMFTWMNRYIGADNVKMELLGFEDLDYFQKMFDIIFAMGIIYHHRDPLKVIENCYAAMKSGGYLILETMGISGDEPFVLVPEKRYAGMKNVWYVPAQKVVRNWLSKAGFKSIELIYNDYLDVYEQRSTEWAPIDSLAQFLSSDRKLTIEGHEAPSRIYFLARK